MKKENAKKEVAKKSKGPKKENFLKRWGKKIKEVFAELKKVTWPSFSKVVKQTGVVIGVVLIFVILITAIDFGLTNLLKLLNSIGG